MLGSGIDSDKAADLQILLVAGLAEMNKQQLVGSARRAAPCENCSLGHGPS